MKRMIDNKEFNKIKQDIININEEIDKNKGVPTITIEASQMSGTTCQLTDEQFEILSNYPVVYIVLADGRTATFYKETLASQSSTIINFVSFANDVNQEDKVETYAFIMIIDTTDKTAIYAFNQIGGSGKQLYQHNIRIRYYKIDGNWNFVATFVRISEKSTSFTDAEIKSLCSTARNVVGGFHGINQAPQPITYIQYVTGETNKWKFNYWTGAANTFTEFNEDDVTLEDVIEDTAYTS